MTIAERIISKKAKIEKVEKSKARIQSKLDKLPKDSSDRWIQVDIEMLTDDLNSYIKEIAYLNKELEELENKQEAMTQLANSRDIKVIIDFLNNWQKEAFEYYTKRISQYWADKKEIDADILKLREEEALLNYYDNRDTLKSIYAKIGKLRSTLAANYKDILRYTDDAGLEHLKKDLQKEADSKYDSIVRKTRELVGNIVDVMNLTISNNGELNGIIIGDKGRAKVATIYAGGYNIQRLHFRVLVNKI